jgi:hypothetical protein
LKCYAPGKGEFKSTPTPGTLSICCALANDRKAWLNTKATQSRSARALTAATRDYEFSPSDVN